MKQFLYILPVLLGMVVAGCAATQPAAPAPEGLTQSGTWVIREDQVMRLAAGAQGRGTLIFEGWQYPFTFAGAKITVTGAEGGEIRGSVYNLDTVSDFEGSYFPRAEFDAANTVTGVWGHNDKGVTLHIAVQGESMGIITGAQGATIKLVEQ